MLSFTLRPGTELSRDFYAATSAQRVDAEVRYAAYRGDWCYEEQGLADTFEVWLGKQVIGGERAAYEVEHDL